MAIDLLPNNASDCADTGHEARNYAATRGGGDVVYRPGDDNRAERNETSESQEAGSISAERWQGADENAEVRVRIDGSGDPRLSATVTCRGTLGRPT